MQSSVQNIQKKKPLISERLVSSKQAILVAAFEKAAQASIVTIVSSGNIIMANKAACKMLGYSKKEILQTQRQAIFDTREDNYKIMLEQRLTKGKSFALLTCIKKNRRSFPCEIASAIFNANNGLKSSITTITDIRPKLQKQRSIDNANKRIVLRTASKAKEISNAMEGDTARWKRNIGLISYDVMWDWDIRTQKIFVGESIEEVFGYKLENNHTSFKDFLRCVIARKRKEVEKKIAEALASTKRSWKDSFSFKRKDGSIAFVTCRANILRDAKGKAINLIGALQDVSPIEVLKGKLEKQLIIHQEDTEIFHQAARLSFDGIWDWNIETNDFFLGEGFEELFGHALEDKNNGAFNWSKYLHPDDKEAVETSLSAALASSDTHWEHSYRFIKANGAVANVIGRANILRNATGKACRMIGVIHDLSRQKDLEDKLDKEITDKSKLINEFEANFKIIFNSTSDVVFDINLLTDSVVISDAYEKQFGYHLTKNMTATKDWLEHIHPDDKAAVKKDYNKMLQSDAIEWKYNYRFIKADQSVANIMSSRIILRHADGKAYRMIGTMQDISKQKVLEEKLALEIRLKEKQLLEAAEDAKETERADLGKELHDNINQLLGASRMYVELARRGGKNASEHLTRSSEYTMSAIEEIRKLSKGLTTDIIKNLGLSTAIAIAADDMMEVSPIKIKVILEKFDEEKVNEKFKLNIYRIVQEQLNNIGKHAQASRVTIGLWQDKKYLRLSIKDNGMGFDTCKKHNGIGLQNIKSRAIVYKGEAIFSSKPGKGCLLSVRFPLLPVI